MKFGPKMLKNGGTPLFSPKNKCVLNDSKWPETHFGNFFFFFWCGSNNENFLFETDGQTERKVHLLSCAALRVQLTFLN